MTDRKTSSMNEVSWADNFKNFFVPIRAAFEDQDRIDEVRRLFDLSTVRDQKNVAKFCEKSGLSYYQGVRELRRANEISFSDPRYLAGCEVGMTTELRKSGKEEMTRSELSDEMKSFASEVKSENPGLAARLIAISAFKNPSFFSAGSSIENIAMGSDFPDELQKKALLAAARCVSSAQAEASRSKVPMKPSTQDER